jgi:xylan 1,4-beta-xylosidase
MKVRLLLFAITSFTTTFAFAQTKPAIKTAALGRVINIHFNQPKGPLHTMFRECVGAGRANEGVGICKKECAFNNIRMHGLLTDKETQRWFANFK